MKTSNKFFGIALARIAMAVVIVVICAISARSQNFQNLDFESAYGLPADPGDGVLVPVTNALPGWTAYAGPLSDDHPYSSIDYADYFDGSYSLVTLVGGNMALSGQYSVRFFVAGTISQTGLVPDNAGYLEFEATINGSPGDLYFTLGDQGLPFSAISEGPDYSTVYEAAIPADLDGQMETLTIGIDDADDAELDNIEFLPVPEPSECALIGLGAILFGFCCRKRVADPL